MEVLWCNLFHIGIRWIVCQEKSESLYLHLEVWVPLARTLRLVGSLLLSPRCIMDISFPIVCWLSSLLPIWRTLLMYKFLLPLPFSWGVLNCFYFSVFARSSKASLCTVSINGLFFTVSGANFSCIVLLMAH